MVSLAAELHSLTAMPLLRRHKFDAAIRKHLCIVPGGALIVEERDGEFRLKPAAVLEFEYYNDAQIDEWDRADSPSSNERRQILESLQSA